MRERVLGAVPGRLDDSDFAVERSASAPAWLNFLRRRPTDSIAGIMAAFTIVAILVNALYLQSGPHPAPIFANKPPAAASADAPGASTLLPRARPIDVRVAAGARPRAETVAEIQRVLARRGFYDGPADGVYGPKTDVAIREFEQAAGLPPTAEPNDVLLQSIGRSPIKARPAAAAPKRNDPIADLLSPNPRLTAVQRALTSYGYGQIKPSGLFDAETRAAIERFERERRLPVTGQISERLTRELTAMTGRPLE